MVGKSLQRVLIGAAVVLLAAGCSTPERAAVPPSSPILLGHGTEVEPQNSTRRVRSIPGWQLRSAAPLKLSEVLESRGFKGINLNGVFFVDGVQQRGQDNLDAVSLDDIERVDLLEGLWGGMSGAGSAVSIITRRR